jgi:hypothetical protein
MIFAKNLFAALKILTPTEKFDAQKSVPFFFFI